MKLLTDRGGAKVYEDVSQGGGVMVAKMPAGVKMIWLQVDINNSGADNKTEDGRAQNRRVELVKK